MGCPGSGLSGRPEMKAAFCKIMVLIIAITPLVACTSFSTKTGGAPLIRTGCPLGLSENYEVSATLTVRTAARNEEYFLALRTAADDAEIALLTLQGIPVYSVHCSRSETVVSAQAQLPGGIHSELLISYLQLIFTDAKSLRRRLDPQWSLDDRDDRRILSHRAPDGATPGAIYIEYTGTPPWFASVQLQDIVQDTSLALEIIGSTHVLPE